MLCEEPLGYRLACISVLHADDQALEVRNTMHIRMPGRIDDQRLTGERVRRAEVRDPFPAGGDGCPRSDAIIGVVVEAGEDAVEVGASVADEPPFAAQHLRYALHEVDV